MAAAVLELSYFDYGIPEQQAQFFCPGHSNGKIIYKIFRAWPQLFIAVITHDVNINLELMNSGKNYVSFLIS